MSKFSVEKTPKQKVSNFVLEHVFAVNITHLPGSDFNNTVDSIKAINDQAGRKIGIPHLAARNFQNKSDLESGLKSLENEISEVLIIGGSTPEGKAFRYADDVLKFIDKEGFKLKTWCAVHPQLERYDEVLKTKYSKYEGGYNQLCLSPIILSKWKSKTRICVPTATSVTGLRKYMELCGITGSLQYLCGNLNGIFYLNPILGFDTKRFIKDIQRLDQSPKEYHLYNFGKLDYTLQSLLSI